MVSLWAKVSYSSLWARVLLCFPMGKDGFPMDKWSLALPYGQGSSHVSLWAGMVLYGEEYSCISLWAGIIFKWGSAGREFSLYLNR